jgi:hypothetical protein
MFAMIVITNILKIEVFIHSFVFIFPHVSSHVCKHIWKCECNHPEALFWHSPVPFSHAKGQGVQQVLPDSKSTETKAGGIFSGTALTIKLQKNLLLFYTQQ